MPVTPKCFASHIGTWAILPRFLQGAVAAIRAGMWQSVGAADARGEPRQPMSGTTVRDPGTAQPESGSPGDPMYHLTAEGVAVLELTGAMQKGRSKFGGVSTVDQRRYLRAAVADRDVKTILLVIDSPGGTVAGTQSLADDVRAADAIKPVLAHFEDLGASAAYWTGSQARRVSANRTAMVGSLGTFGVIEDSSGRAAAEGVVVHVISTGPHKGAFIDGAPVKPEQLQEYQRMVDALNEEFIKAVAGGRRVSVESARKLFDGRVHLAAEAKELLLIDAVESLDSALSEATRIALASGTEDDRARRTRTAGAKART